MRVQLFSFSVILFLSFAPAFAQHKDGTIKVKVLDASDHKPVYRATVNARCKANPPARGEVWRSANIDFKTHFALLKEIPLDCNCEITASSSFLYEDQMQPNVRAIAGTTKEITIYLFRAGPIWDSRRAIPVPPPAPGSYGWMKKKGR